MNTLILIFIIALALVFYTYIGYGIILFVLVKAKELFVKERKKKLPEDLPKVTLLIAAYNEEDIIDSKMDNCYSLDYPKDRLKIVWVTDGSSDNTNSLLSNYNNVTVLFENKRLGKSAAINRAVPLLDTEIVIFTDANTMLNKESVKEIVKSFEYPAVGCVAGEKRVISHGKEGASSAGEGMYWRYESVLKSLDSRLYSAVGAAGELYALRRELFEPVPPDTLLDDFIMSMTVVERGFKIHYCKEAYAAETGSADMREEKKRKVRISAGGIQSIIRLLPLMNVFRNPLFAFQYISHRVLRWTLTPIALFMLLPVNIALVLMGAHYIFTVILVVQLIFYTAAAFGKILEDRKIRNKILFIPYYFIFMNLNVIRGFFYLIKKSKGDGTWEKAKRG